MGFELPQPIEIGEPAVSDRGADQVRQRRICLQQPAPLRNTVGLVVEPFRTELKEVRRQRCLDQFGMNCGDSVDRVASHHRQIGHAHLFGRGLLDDRHPLDALDISRVGGRNPIQKAAVDLIDDLQVPRKHGLEQGNRPLLQRFRRERVIGVSEGCLRDGPRLLPLQILFIHEDAHQLRDRQSGMRVVQLNRNLCGEVLESVVLLFEPADDIPNRAGDEKVLLHQDAAPGRRR